MAISTLPTRPAAVNPHTAKALQNAVWRLADHFEVEGTACDEAIELAYRVLQIDRTELEAELCRLDAKAEDARAYDALFMMKAKALIAAHTAAH